MGRTVKAVSKPHIVKGDTVVLRRGKEKGKRGIVKHVFPKDGVATVEGLNVVKRHTKPGQAGQGHGGGILGKEAPIPMGALMVARPRTESRRRTLRARHS